MSTPLFTHSLTQQTINNTVSCIGIGLHSGKNVSMVIHPADTNSGINFIRKDVNPGQGFISGRWYNVVDTKMSTTIGNEYGVTLQTVEHLLAALRGCGIDNALIEIDGPEVPIMDGSSAPFVDVLLNVGIKDQKEDRNVIWIQRPIEYRNGDKYAILMPGSSSKFTAEIQFDNTVIGTSVWSFDLTHDDFKNTMSCARTFGFADEINSLIEVGLIKGGSLSNAIIVDGKEILNKEGLRFKNEFIRHKVLDCIGDFALVGYQILGSYYAKKPGHELNHQFIKALVNNRSAWSYISLREYNNMFGIRHTEKSNKEQHHMPRAIHK